MVAAVEEHSLQGDSLAGEELAEDIHGRHYSHSSDLSGQM